MPRAKQARWLLLLALGLTSCFRYHVLGDTRPELDRFTRLLPLFDPAAVFEPEGLALGRIRAAELPSPAIVEYGPIGTTHANAEIQVRFNRPMVPFGAVMRPEVDPAVFRIDPPLAGDAHWAGPSRLVFRPNGRLPPATVYTVTVTPPLPADSGLSPGSLSRTWQLVSERPSVEIDVVEAPQRRADRRSEYPWTAGLMLEPNQPLRRATLLEHLEVSGHDAHGNLEEPAFELLELPAEDDEPPRFELRPTTRWPAEQTVHVRIDGDLTGELGPASMGADRHFWLHTTAGVRASGPICTQQSHPEGCELGPVALSFDAPVDARQARHVHVSPEPPGFAAVAVDPIDERAPDGRPVFGNVVIWGDFEADVDYAITLDAGLRDMHGQPIVGERSFDLRFVHSAPSLSINGARTTLDLAAGSTLGVDSRYLDEIALTVAVLDDEAHERLLDYDFHALYFPADLPDTRRERIHPTHVGRYGWSSEGLDLGRFTGGKPGVVALELRATEVSPTATSRRLPHRQFGLVQLTELGVSVVGSVPGSVVRVARLRDDTPIEGASVELIDHPGGPRETIGETDARGLLALPSSTELGERSLLRVRKGDDQTLIEIGELEDSLGERPGAVLRPWESTKVELDTDRKIYLPGETIHVIGWAAIATPYELRGLRPIPGRTPIALALVDPHGAVVAKRTVVAKPHGKFWATIDLPSDGALGHFELRAWLLGELSTHSIRVLDLQPPDFELEAQIRSFDVHPGDAPEIDLWAEYLFGGDVPLTIARHSTHCESSSYRPPGLPDGFSVSRLDDHAPKFADGEVTPAQPSGRLGYSLARTPSLAGPAHCTHYVSADDRSARSNHAEVGFLVHPKLYLALAVPELVADEDATFEVRALHHDGSPAPLERAEVVLTPDPWEPEDFASPGDLDPRRCRIHLVDGRGTCRIRKLVGGNYDIRVRARHEGIEYRIDEWDVAREPEPEPEPDASDPPPPLALHLANNSLDVGDTAKLELRATWASGRALVILGKSGVHELHDLTIADGRASLALEVGDAWIPGVEFRVLAVEPGPSPTLRRAETSVQVSRRSRSLTVELHAPSEAQTRERIPIEIEVRDHLGRPTAGHVAVWAVDEAMLALADDYPPYLPYTFSGSVDRYPYLDVTDSYASVLAPFVPRPDPYSPREFDPNWLRGVIGLGYTGLIGKGGGGGTGYARIQSTTYNNRVEFESTPFFVADAVVDANGHAHVEGRLPDNLTTFRLFAIASAPLLGSSFEGRSGAAEARVRVTRPLVVRAAIPRILRPGDRAEVGVIVDNLSGPAGTLEVTVDLPEGEGLAELVGPRVRQVQVGAGEQVRVPFTLRAHAVGPVRLSARAQLGAPGREPSERDAIELPLKIEPEPVATERVAVHAWMWGDGVARLPIALPPDVDPHHGGLRVALSDTLFDGLDAAVDFLLDYPHRGAEPSASQILALVGPAAELPLDVEDRPARVAAAIARLETMHVSSDGFAAWPHGWASPSVTAYATRAIERAREAGHPLPYGLLERADQYLETELGYWSRSRGPALVDDIEAALMLHALAERGKAPAGAIESLFERRARLPLFAKASLLLAIIRGDQSDARKPRIDALTTELLAFVEQTEASARVVDEGDRWIEFWDSEVQTSALLLEAVIATRSDDVLVTKLVRGLLDMRRGGRWANPHDNALALAALAEYGAGREPGFRWTPAQVWLDNEVVTRIEGRDEPTFAHGFVPMATLLDASQADGVELLLERSGFGRLYYTVDLEWATRTTAPAPARDAGLALTRELRDADGPIAAGDAIANGRVLALDVSITTGVTVSDVVIEIPLPAGLEAMLELEQRGVARLSGKRAGWVTHAEQHRDRVALFADRLAPGEHRTTVFVRATIPGDFSMPAARAELMYYPEIYGRTSARRVVVR